MGYIPSMTLLSSKLTPPAGPLTLIRDRLIQAALIPGATPARLIQIIAGAGFGKTTLAAQLRDQAISLGLPCIWYRLDEFDRDFSLFMAYLTQGLKPKIPD
ncbi:MAG: hypothetical protein MI749_10020, partial [Desulfovibrionales bacterium]|nr:hypothetical protein [Desulfovibrionales bacterium]